MGTTSIELAKRFNIAITAIDLDEKSLEKALKGYYEILKPGVKLLTHDVCLLTDDKELQKEVIAALTRSINVHVQPKTVNEWINIFSETGYKDIKFISGRWH